METLTDISLTEEMVEKARIYLADNHPLVCLGLSRLLVHVGEYQVCGQAHDVESLLNELEIESPDVLIVDLAIGSENGLELLDEIKSRHPDMKIIVLSTGGDWVIIEESIKRGAQAYITKDEHSGVILNAVEQVLQGKIYVADNLCQRLVIDSIMRRPGQAHSISGNLTERELEVFKLIGNGLSVKEIAGDLGISVSTVEYHRRNIKRKLMLDTSSDLRRSAIRWGRINNPGRSFRTITHDG